MLRSIEAHDHMTEMPVTVHPDTPLFEAIGALLERSISGATVVDDDGKVVGVLSEMDCLQAIIAGAYHGEAGGRVGDVMTKEVETADPDASILEVARQLIRGHRRRLPVVKNGKFVGQYSCRSMLRAVVALTDAEQPAPH
ncbi:MAG: CBS domain-containing protein [Planctomycetota bacterium]